MVKFYRHRPIPWNGAALLKSSQAQSLSAYECEECLNYPSVYCIGAGSQKKQAHPDFSANNFGYDDERGDYLVVNNDHLACRYEVVDTTGKGSFGQVLNCRDHQTGESVAIKIIRNKKRLLDSYTPLDHQTRESVAITLCPSPTLPRSVCTTKGVQIVSTIPFMYLRFVNCDMCLRVTYLWRHQVPRRLSLRLLNNTYRLHISYIQKGWPSIP